MVAWRLTRAVRCLVVAVVPLAVAWPAAAHAQSPSRAPILVVTDPADEIGRFYPEILRAEGLNAFDVADVSALDASALASRDVVLLASRAVTDAQAGALGTWVDSGGNLIAVRPDAKLAPILGLTRAAGEQPSGYLKADPSTGVTTEALQVHATAQRWSPAAALPVAALYSNATTATPWPAVTRRAVGGAGGEAAAFTFDLARSIVSTRQGNPAWVGQERDNAAPAAIRSSDLFFPNWVDFSRIRIPQADEQQRLLANLITNMARDRMPMPRFWYLPRGEKAAVVLTGDDHGNAGTAGQFDLFEAASPAGCSVADWECVRATSYMYPRGPLTNAAASAYRTAGFELALHLDAGCAAKTASQLDALWASQLTAFKSAWPSLGAPVTNRTHCISWDGWTTTAQAERARGIRLDTNYYYWPAAWVRNRPGLFTGSGFPMRFAGSTGAPIDVYQAATQITDEWEAQPNVLGSIPAHIRTLLDGALGPNGYYGVFTANMHTDEPSSPGANAIVSEAVARGVPVVSAAQMLEWLDGRNGSSFRGLRFADGRLTFTLDVAPGARGIEAMLPAAGLKALTRDGAPVATGGRTVKGIDYAVFAGVPGAYTADYSPAAAPPAPAAPAAPRPRDRSRPKAKLRTRKVRTTRSGRIWLRVSCPRSERRCFVDLRLLRHGKRLAGTRTRFTVAGSKTARIAVRLPRKLRRRLATAGSQRLVVVLRVRDAAGNRRTTRHRLRVLPPRHRRR